MLTDKSEWKGVSITSVSQFARSGVDLVMRKAETMREAKIREDLKGKVLGLLFYEPSTRTRCSFEAAMQRLGGTTVLVTQDSSIKKGESLEDTIKMLMCYCDGVVLRHPEPGASQRASQLGPIINAGDGIGEHPTQALLDVYTLSREMALEGKTIALIGDLKHGRTTHSLAKLLALYDVKLLYVAPDKLKMPDLGVAHEECSLEEAVEVADALYVTRIQKERFASVEEYDALKGSYKINPDLMTKAKSTCVVLHPLPRNDEIDPAFDSDPRAAYFRQAQNGMYVRMALLSLFF